ncbi:ABC transporter ATP-binding protein [Xanthobacter tagetidis]|jgi:putative spermidine/putrescine transport system ATP-binding protein|uniref:ABC transporter ATP-binding protein n=1 Tax=Xanthobacter tagetidis TaxID=60216 RepID=A0A3L7AQ90_9HYPH|nr:ABC transporter ATP-binding protein [Xanthobacter tagetidis]MBB6308205.1 putative spermidine/putrescine transport system ATP-binding protein [Xanthobacter tagetidis]RLP81821.1 ABC transporter ATP-binding protein [Xanthobacter tagetidis]
MKPRTGAAVTLAGCGKTFADGTRALAPLDLSVAAGETLVLLGPSGCGKTTLLRIIAGLESPDAGGRVLFDGADVTALPIEKRNVGMVFQSYALFPNMNVRENVAYGLRVRGVGKAERSRLADEVLEMMRIDALAERRITQLSGGQRQRVALARALAVRPKAILLDEPMAALDAALREHLRGEIDALLRRLSITAVYVTHDQAEALALGDRIVVMREGEIAQVGTPREVYERPADAFVASFVGTTNRLEGTVRGGRFACAAGTMALDAPDMPKAALLFRPEAARLVLDPPAGLVLKVEQVQFQGARQKVTLCTPDSVRVVVETPPDLEIAPGMLMGLALDPNRFSLV